MEIVIRAITGLWTVCSMQVESELQRLSEVGVTVKKGELREVGWR